MAWTDGKGFNFRSTLGGATDTGNQLFYGFAHTYPTTRTHDGDSVTAGYTSLSSLSDDATGAAIDPRFGGYIASSGAIGGGSDFVFQIDLPAAGAYRVRFAMGNRTAAPGTATWQIIDNATTRVSSEAVDNSNAGFFDASGVLRATPGDWISSNVSVDVTFTSTTFIFKMGNSAGFGQRIAHLFVQRIGGGPTTPPALGRYRRVGPAR